MTFSLPSTNSSPLRDTPNGSQDTMSHAIRGVEHPRSKCSEFSLTITPRSDEDLVSLFGRLSTLLLELDAAVLKMTVFGSIEAYDEGIGAMRRVFGKLSWPMTWIEGASCNGHAIAGMQVIALFSGDVRRVEWQGRVIGSVFEDAAARHCLLTGLLPRSTLIPRAEQAHQVLENLETCLDQAGFSLADVARTWFFNDKLLDWYREFNHVRTSVFSGIGFCSGSPPASTGVAGRNAGGAALTMDAWATRPLNSESLVEAVASPLQCPAPAYGSSFSRAMEAASTGVRRLFISGTASITPEGYTAHAGDVEAQIDLSMDVVKAILESRRMTFADVSRATAYFKSAADMPVFTDWLDRHTLRTLPVISVCCDICRDDLLFEIELDAWQVNA